MSKELKLYKLLVTEENRYSTYLIDEIYWAENELLVWIPWTYIQEVIEGLKSIFGSSIFDEGGFQINCSDEYTTCINLEEILSGYGIDLKEVFPKEKYVRK